MTTRDGNTRESTALLILKQSGNDITGTVGPHENERLTISKGKIDGNKITLEAQHEDRSIKFDLTLTGDRIKGEAIMSAPGETRKATLDLTRAK